MAWSRAPRASPRLLPPAQPGLPLPPGPKLSHPLPQRRLPWALTKHTVGFEASRKNRTSNAWAPIPKTPMIRSRVSGTAASTSGAVGGVESISIDGAGDCVETSSWASSLALAWDLTTTSSAVGTCATACQQLVVENTRGMFPLT